MWTKKNGIIGPSYHQGFARSAGESKYPDLWKNLAGAWFPSLGATGRTLRDTSPFKKHGQISGATWINSGRGPVLSFDGISNNVDMSAIDDFSADLVNDFTIAWWQNYNDNGSIQQSLFGSINDGTKTYFQILLSYNGSAYEKEEICVILRDEDGGGVLEIFSTTNPLRENIWQSIVIVRSSNILRIYVNNVEVASGDVSAINNTSASFDYPLKLGCTNNRGSLIRFLDGQIDSFLVWVRALSAGERMVIYQNPDAMLQRRQYLIVFLSGAIYQGSGTAISPVISFGGEVVDWSAFSNTIATPDDSSATVEIRTSNDGITWSGYGAIESAANSIFAQIRITLNANTGATQTPAVSIIALRALIANALMPFHFEGIKYISVSLAYTVILVPEREVIINVDTDSAAITVTLPAILNLLGKIYTIRNIGTSGNDVTVTPNGAETIDSGTITDGNSIKITPVSSTNWGII